MSTQQHQFAKDDLVWAKIGENKYAPGIVMSSDSNFPVVSYFGDDGIEQAGHFSLSYLTKRHPDRDFVVISSGMISDILIERISDLVGMSPGAWDVIDPKAIVSAAIQCYINDGAPAA